jgi:hypothetical protein
MSWSAIISAITGLVGLIRDFFLWKKSVDDRKAGADAAINAGRALEDEAIKRTQASMDEADMKPIEYRD